MSDITIDDVYLYEAEKFQQDYESGQKFWCAFDQYDTSTRAIFCRIALSFGKPMFHAYHIYKWQENWLLKEDKTFRWK